MDFELDCVSDFGCGRGYSVVEIPVAVDAKVNSACVPCSLSLSKRVSGHGFM